MKIILIILLVCYFRQIYAQWDILNYPWTVRLANVEFVSENVGWIPYGDGLLLKTEDGGKTWMQLNIDFKDLYFVDFINEKVGWGISRTQYGDNILKTINGGQDWVIQWNGLIGNCIYAVDSSVVYVAGLNIILKTVDGGDNWTEVFYGEDDFFSSIQFFNRDSGILAGFKDINSSSSGFILQTYDGGNSWRRINNERTIAFSDIQFINDSTGYFIATAGNGRNSLCYTSNNFKGWTTILDISFDITSYSLFENENLCASFFSDSIGYYQNMLSNDGGITWERLNILSSSSQWDQIYFHSAALGIINKYLGIGRGGIIGQLLYRTDDGGNNWEIPEFSYPLYSVSFPNKDLGFVAGGISEWHGGSGDVFKTEDGGETWTISFHSTSQVKSLYFINSELGFILTNQTQTGSFTKIHKTIDGGTQWTEVYSDDGDSSGFFFSGSEINFLNEDIGWVSGSASDYDSSGAAFLHTKNGGSTWHVKWVKSNIGYYDYKISSSFFLKPTLGWAVGEGGIIVKYSNDQWEVQNSVTDLPLKDVFFSDERHGWISGGYLNEHNFQSILLYTSDGGITWNDKIMNEYLINDLFFKDSLTGFAVGHDSDSINSQGSWQLEFGRGAILKTNDGGENWYAQISDLSGNVTAIYFNKDYGWAVGETGLVLRTDDGITWVDQHTGKSYTDNFKLSQNYPNPFNPSTTINYLISKQCNVTLKVFDVLGSEVSTLVNKEQSQGNYKVEFDGSELTSGIYFYRLQACPAESGIYPANSGGRDFVETKKMILLR